MGILENLNEVLGKIAAAAEKSGRNPDEITLVAVSKTKPVELIKEAVGCGVTQLGENRVQEVMEKFEYIEGANWHLIGHLQKNKVKYIVDKAVLIHSVDSFELAKEIDKHAKKVGKIQDILIQVNISGEESKSGIEPLNAEEICRQVAKLENVKIKGFMTMAPREAGESELHRIFGGLKALMEEIKEKNIENVELKELSMGMSGDYEIAIMEGATIVRVGTGIFGTR